MTELSNLSIADLRKLQEQVDTAMLQKARDQILAIAQSVGVPLKSLLPKRGKGINQRASSGPAAVRFQHPEDPSQQWSGRGRQPKWVKEWVESDKPLDGLRVS